MAAGQHAISTNQQPETSHSSKLCRYGQAMTNISNEYGINNAENTVHVNDLYLNRES